jgi:type VI secretion system Hcp family effector
MRKEKKMATTSLDWMSGIAGSVDYYLDLPSTPGEALATGFEKQIAVDAFSFNVEQTLNIGSQSSGAGAGKITFNPFQIKKHYDASSPKLFQAACVGQPFQKATFSIVRTGSGNTAGTSAPKPYLVIKFALIAVKTITIETLGAYPMEIVSFEYGAASFAYSTLNPQTNALTPATQFGWDRVKNITWTPS